LPKISDYRDDFLMARLIWSAVGISDIPQLQAWRYEKLNRIIEAYL
jgi:hypothetical protein